MLLLLPFYRLGNGGLLYFKQLVRATHTLRGQAAMRRFKIVTSPLKITEETGSQKGLSSRKKRHLNHADLLKCCSYSDPTNVKNKTNLIQSKE